jgi:hypothetical protein
MLGRARIPLVTCSLVRIRLAVYFPSVSALDFLNSGKPLQRKASRRPSGLSTPCHLTPHPSLLSRWAVPRAFFPKSMEPTSPELPLEPLLGRLHAFCLFSHCNWRSDKLRKVKHLTQRCTTKMWKLSCKPKSCCAIFWDLVSS